ncbi:MAG: adenylate/guanylate cyclase domain-containing protein [Pseudomonadota bacterium]
MRDLKVGRVFVQSGTGQEWIVGASCSIGRAEENDIILKDDKVSRRHALIHRQDDRSYWIIDLGSGNGTYLNGKRLSMPTALKNEDRIQIARQSLTFFHDTGYSEPATGPSGVPMETVIEISERRVWLVVGDLVGSSRLAAQLPPEEAARFVGRWLSDCGKIVDTCDGSINKYLGDGFLAYWADDKTAAGSILKALQQFVRLGQQDGALKFRLAIHLGKITAGGSGSMGEESLMGLDVNYVFRMEKLAASLNTQLLFSSTAKAALADLVPLTSVGSHALEGFDHANPPEFFALS